MSEMIALRSFKGGKAPAGMSEAYYQAGVKAIMWKWAVKTQLENYRRLSAQVTADGKPMKPLSRFWKLYKAISGLSTKIGQKTGEMLREVGATKNIKIKFSGQSVLAQIQPASSLKIKKRIEGFVNGYKQVVSSEAMQRKLEIMAEDAGVKPAFIKWPPGEGPFAEGKILEHPARNWIKRNPEADEWARAEIIHLIKTQRRRV